MSDRPYLQIPLPPPSWCDEEQRMKDEKEQEEKETLDDQPRVIILDI